MTIFRHLWNADLIISNMLKFLCSLAVLFIITACNKAPNCSEKELDKAKKSFDVKVIQKCAAAGNTYALVQLGIYYEAGQYIPQDYHKAMQCYEKAAEQGDTAAMMQIAALYEGNHAYSDNESPFKDANQAIFWYKRAVDMGNNYSAAHLGIIYTENKLVPQDYHEAFKWFSKAAEDDIRAKYFLGLSYLYGHGVVQNYDLAAKWLKKTSEHFLYTGTYESLIETNPEFIGLRIRNTHINDLRNIFSSIHKLKPQVYGDYIFGAFVIDPNNLPIQNVKKNLLLFHKDGFLECIRFVFFDDVKLKKFFELKDMFDKKYNKLVDNEFKSGFKYAIYEYGGSIIELNSNPNPLEVVLTLRSKFFHSLLK